ncbi:hypothetical protein JCM10212_002586, partial [Sporobolomyces blumeae]
MLAVALLLLALEAVLASPIVPTFPLQPPPWNCTLASWVRAPDLSANRVVDADARLVLDGPDCQPDIVQWSVGLELRERAVVKLRAATVVLPPRPVWNETAENAFWESRDQSVAYNNLFSPAESYFDPDSTSPYETARKAY